MGGLAWTEEEDHLLRKCIEQHGEGKWHRVPLLAGLNRSRKSCRVRWLNYLRPNIKRGSFTKEEVELIIKLHKLLGNRWSLIAGRLQGRTENDVKNYWNCHLSKRLTAREEKQMGTSTEELKPRPRNVSTTSIRKLNSEAPSCHSSQEESVSTAMLKVEDELRPPMQTEESHKNLSSGEYVTANYILPAGFQSDEMSLSGHGQRRDAWNDMVLDMDLWSDYL